MPPKRANENPRNKLPVFIEGVYFESIKAAMKELSRRLKKPVSYVRIRNALSMRKGEVDGIPVSFHKRRTPAPAAAESCELPPPGQIRRKPLLRLIKGIVHRSKLQVRRQNVKAVVVPGVPRRHKQNVPAMPPAVFL